MQNRNGCGFVVAASRRHGIICPVGECKPQAKHALSGIDTMFLSEHERYPKCELRKWYIVRETTGKGKWQIAAATVKESS